MKSPPAPQPPLHGQAASGGAAVTNPAYRPIVELLTTIKAAPGQAKLQHVALLADALVRGLQIEHLNVFLKLMKKKLILRAQREGVRAPPSKGAGDGAEAAPSKPPAAAPKTAPTAPAAQPAAAPKLAAAPKPAAARPQGAAFAAAKAAAGRPARAATPPPAPRVPPPPQRLARRQSSAASLASTLLDTNSGDLGASPPASPPANDLAAAGDSQDLFALVGELTEDPVCVDGDLNEERLEAVLRRLWTGTARRPKDWVSAWQAMVIPVELQSQALQKLFNIAFLESKDPGKAPGIVADLVKNHKVKMKSVEDVLAAFGEDLDGILAVNPEVLSSYAMFLMHVHPKPATAGWGWSRVGWSWLSWWQFAERVVATLDAERGLDVLAMALQLVQEKEGVPLAELQSWIDGAKLDRAVTRVCERLERGRDEIVERFRREGVEVP